MGNETTAAAVGADRDLAELYEREWARLARAAYLLVGSWQEAEDLVQEAFLKLQSTSTDVANPGAYLRTTVVNGARSALRHRAVVERTGFDHPDRNEDRPDELSDVFARLPWRHQAVLVLRYHLDLPEEEIAATLGCRPATVRSIAARALARLRKELGE